MDPSSDHQGKRKHVKPCPALGVEQQEQGGKLRRNPQAKGGDKAGGFVLPWVGAVLALWHASRTLALSPREIIGSRWRSILPGIRRHTAQCFCASGA